MIVKSFVLRRESFQAIVEQCVSGTIAVVRPEKALQTLFKDLISRMIVLKQPAREETEAVAAYLDAVSQNPQYQLKKTEFMDYVQDYLRKAMSYSVPVASVEDYILAQCALLCAQAVGYAAGVPVMDGRELVVCQSAAGVFDWAATRSEIEYKCKGKTPLVISGGYARSPQGMVLGIGKGGANMMASLIASALGADITEFYVEGEGIHGIPSMTYDEAAHYCAAPKAPFPSAALWPAKKAGIPIVVKSILHPQLPGTRISTGSEETPKFVSGVIADKDLNLVTVYGTGLMGQVGASSAIFSALAGEGVNVRFISQTSSEYAISFAVRSSESENVSALMAGLMADNPLMPMDDVVVLHQAVGIVTVYGSRMKNIPGVSGKVFSLFGDAGINVIASAQGGEELSISVVLDLKDIDKAQQLLEGL